MTRSSVGIGRFTFLELLALVVVIVVMAGMIWPVTCRSREPARRVNCAGNLKQIGLSMLMYSGDHDGYFPTTVPGGQEGELAFNFYPLIAPIEAEDGRIITYLNDGKVFNCPSRTNPAAGAVRSAYVYMASGIKDENSEATEVSIARDESGNHPGDEWRNYLFVDGHVEGIRP